MRRSYDSPEIAPAALPEEYKLLKALRWAPDIKIKWTLEEDGTMAYGVFPNGKTAKQFIHGYLSQSERRGFLLKNPEDPDGEAVDTFADDIKIPSDGSKPVNVKIPLAYLDSEGLQSILDHENKQDADLDIGTIQTGPS